MSGRQHMDGIRRLETDSNSEWAGSQPLDTDGDRKSAGNCILDTDSDSKKGLRVTSLTRQRQQMAGNRWPEMKGRSKWAGSRIDAAWPQILGREITKGKTMHDMSAQSPPVNHRNGTLATQSHMP